ncbi:MAG TPA: hypothetical protein VMF11_15975 [Candidatus Baltobacteraceae bacterium]|nr:hypothetical protein [Candidatus Baltobacteraceae bacterium]
MKIKQSIIAGLVGLVIIALIAHGRSSPYNNYVLLAQAFLHGHAWINWPGNYIDALPYHGQYFIIEGPMPAILLLPFVAVFGTFNQTALAIALGAVAVGAAYELGERFGVPRTANIWICAFLLAGTDLLWCAMLGDVWFIAHVCAVAFTLLALVELAGKRRGWLVGIYAGCALFSRFDLVLALPVYAYLLRDRMQLRSFGAVLVPIALLWVGYNLARWGMWYDIGYGTWYHQDQAGSPTGSPFRLMYFPYQLWSFFVQGPQRIASYPWLVPSISGVALTWTSPALVFALFARKPVQWVAPLWIATLLCAGPNFLYYVNGFAQFGMRHALDFEPFLVALMFLAAKERLPRWAMALMAYSIVVGLWGVWYWNVFVRTS